VLASVWHAIWVNVFWASGGPRYIWHAILFDLAILFALVVLVLRAMGRLGQTGGSPTTSGLQSDRDDERGVGEFATSLNPLHHEPLPPFPGSPDEEAK
jgi:hypothetical protein